MTKPNKDGWIRHRGGKCSAPELSVVEVRLRNGTILPAHDCERFTWEHSAVETDRQIMAYRVVDMREPVSYEDDYCDCEGPIQWRDRIREIDAASKEEEARHCAAMAEYDEERTSLVAQLKAEGFALIQGDEPNSGEESAQDDIAQQDMSDPANWRVGDQVEIVESSNPGWKQYKGMTGKLQNDGDWFIDFDSENWYVSDNTEVKFHSRPTN